MDNAIKDLDNDKARDTYIHANELFKEKFAGRDLKLATLKFMNHMEKEHRLLKALQACNIIILYNNKGSQKDLIPQPRTSSIRVYSNKKN